MTEQLGAKAVATIERRFFLAFFLIGLLGVALGFIPPTLRRMSGHAAYPAPLMLQIHAGMFLLWVAVFGAQVFLVRERNLLLHRQLGAFAAIMIPVMVGVSLFAEAYAEQFYAVREPGSQRFFIIPLYRCPISCCSVAAAFGNAAIRPCTSG